MRRSLANDGVALPCMNHNGGLVSHRAAGHEHAFFFTGHLRRQFLELAHRRVLSVAIVSHFGIEHCQSHFGGRFRDGVASQVDHFHIRPILAFIQLVLNASLLDRAQSRSLRDSLAKELDIQPGVASTGYIYFETTLVYPGAVIERMTAVTTVANRLRLTSAGSSGESSAILASSGAQPQPHILQRFRLPTDSLAVLYQ